jgi:pimeloyl-ACP methyl ester carboxylesterase
LLLSGLPHRRQERVQGITLKAMGLVWRALGFTVEAHQFGWYHDQSFDEGMSAVGHALSRSRFRGQKPYVVGASAGGLAALAALHRYPNSISGVVTIASPIEIPREAQATYWATPRIPNLMYEAYNEVQLLLNDPDLDPTRIVSLYGETDSHVSPDWSQPQNARIRRHEVAGHTHSTIILGAMGINAARTAALLPDVV